jgi:hypothetical protein
MKQISVRVTQETLDAFRTACQVDGLFRNRVIGELLDLYSEGKLTSEQMEQIKDATIKKRCSGRPADSTEGDADSRKPSQGG